MSREQVLHQLSALADTASGLTGWGELDDAELVEAAALLARTKALVEASLVAVTDRLTDVDTARTSGWASAKDLLTHLTGGRKGTGGSYVRLAESLRQLPAVKAALDAGGLSMSQARVIASRVGTMPQDAELRTKAAEAMVRRVRTQGLDATDVDHSFGEVMREIDPEGTLARFDRDKPHKERTAHLTRFLSFSTDQWGGVRLKGYGTPEEAELIKAVLMPMAAPVTTQPGACGGEPKTAGSRDDSDRRAGSRCPDPVCAHDGRDRREAGARLWDALVEACRRLQAADVLPHDHAQAARITITTSYEDLRSNAVEAGVLADGDTLSGTALRRLACDAELLPAVLGTRGQILDVGRAGRLVTAGIWSALVLRDAHCTFPGCRRLPLACDAHHLVHWADGGPTSLDNLALLCRLHHTLAHATPWTVELDPVTRRPVWHPPPPVDDRANFTYLPAA